MKPNGELAQWLNRAKSGRCPCGRVRPEGNDRLCGRAVCREKYQRLYGRDRTLTTLRRVVGRTRVSGRPRFLRLRLECNHFQEVPRSKAMRSKKRHCQECLTGQPFKYESAGARAESARTHPRSQYRPPTPLRDAVLKALGLTSGRVKDVVAHVGKPRHSVAVTLTKLRKEGKVRRMCLGQWAAIQDEDVSTSLVQVSTPG